MSHLILRAIAAAAVLAISLPLGAPAAPDSSAAPGATTTPIVQYYTPVPIGTPAPTQAPTPTAAPTDTPAAAATSAPTIAPLSAPVPGMTFTPARPTPRPHATKPPAGIVTPAPLATRSPIPAADVSPEPPGPEATAFLEDPIVTARAREWLLRLQSNNLDRKQMNKDFSASLTPARVKEVAAQVAAFGTLVSFTFHGAAKYPQGVVYTYNAQFTLTLASWYFATDTDGKVGGMLLTKPGP